MAQFGMEVFCKYEISTQLKGLYLGRGKRMQQEKSGRIVVTNVHERDGRFRDT
jgi:hypothetical protein